MNKLKVTLLFFLVLISTTLFDARAESENSHRGIISDPNESTKMPVYNLEIASSKEISLSDKSESVNPPDPVIVFINDNPIMFFSWGTKIKQINQYLKPGTNTVAVKGKKEQEIKIEIKLFEKNKNKEGFAYQNLVGTVLEKSITTDTKPHQWEGNFIADIGYRLPIFENKGSVKDITKKEIMVLLKDLHDKYKNHKLTELKKMSMQGYGFGAVTAYGQSKEKTDEFIDSALKSMKKKEFLPVDESRVNLIYGKDLVLVYAGFEGPFNDAYLWEIIQNKQKFYSPPLIITKINDKLIFWE